MHTITEETADIWAEPSAKIIELIEQFKNETAFYAEMMSLWRKNTSAFDIEKFESEQISKLATIYSKMQPESTYAHVHEYYYFPERYFGVHT
ncbi:unnamed protein product [Gongylonema pulchrum]|uniref:Peptidase_M13_N domain-containing protein n=1 Tax=Gongylonema pulchrum TaxID=637853 RepID=A0A183D6Q4_9BILA|nr:unnamed protein product [Gongylonema pulchrum]